MSCSRPPANSARPARLTASPPLAIASIGPARISCSEPRRWTASTKIASDTPTEQGALGERHQDLRAVVAVGALRRGGALREAHREQTQREGDHVDQHVTGVGQQGERARQDAADHLRQHVARGQREHAREPSLLAVLGGRFAGAVAVVVGHARAW